MILEQYNKKDLAKLKEKKLFLLDMDGTLYLDDSLFPKTKDFLSAIKEKGGKYLFLTNNSSKGIDSYVEKMNRLGIPSTSEDFLTSIDALIETLKKKKDIQNKKIYIMGTESFKKQMTDKGFKVTETAGPDVDMIILGFDRELTFKKLDDVSRMLSEDKEGRIDYLATNPDWVCPTEYGYVPDCGSMAWMLEKATGRLPVFIGKPCPDMALIAMKKHGFSPDETVIIGDRPYTDIKCGNNAGIDTVFVLSGEGTLKNIEAKEADPTWIMDGIGDALRIV